MIAFPQLFTTKTKLAEESCDHFLSLSQQDPNGIWLSLSKSYLYDKTRLIRLYWEYFVFPWFQNKLCVVKFSWMCYTAIQWSPRLTLKLRYQLAQQLQMAFYIIRSSSKLALSNSGISVNTNYRTTLFNRTVASRHTPLWVWTFHHY